MARLELQGVSKTYPGGIAAASAVNLAIESGALGVLLGPSGSGKSTLLRLIAGLETLDAGSIHLGDRRIDGLAPRDRDLAMVFQDVVVYPHLDVFENIAFGLRARRVARAEVQDRVAQTASTLGLSATLRRSPTTLSGGQKRRVTLARALVLRPRLLLLDEPFSGLDAPLRASIRAEIADLHRQTGTTIVLVTHDQAEALALADQIAVVESGRVVQVGSPLDIYETPLNSFVARFVGQPPMTLIPCTLRADGPASIRVEPNDAPLPQPWVIQRASHPTFDRLTTYCDATVILGLRAEHVRLTDSTAGPPATVDRLEPAGYETIVTLRFGPHQISARINGRPTVRVGDVVALAVDLDLASWFDPATSAQIG